MKSSIPNNSTRNMHMPPQTNSDAHNIDNYRHHFADTEVSDEDAAELIHMLMQILKAFVDCGFQIDPVQCVLGETPKELHGSANPTLGSDIHHNNKN